jgi:hypothetical protein
MACREMADFRRPSFHVTGGAGAKSPRVLSLPYPSASASQADVAAARDFSRSAVPRPCRGTPCRRAPSRG